MNRLLLLFGTLLAIQIQAQQTVGLFENTAQAFNGYTLFSPTSYTHTYLVDNCGLLVNEWTAGHTPGLSSYLLPGGKLLRTARNPASVTFNGGGIGGTIEIYDWDDNLEWSYEFATNTYHQHHDIEPLPNGNILVLAWELLTAQDAIALGRNPANLQGALWPTYIAELKIVGSNDALIVWEWHMQDHFIQDFDITQDNFGIIADHPELLDININEPTSTADFVHANSIDYNPILDQILISSQQLSEILVIDHSTTTNEAAGHSGGLYGKGGDFLYRWGNPENYDRGNNDDQQLFFQHDASWVEDGSPDVGKISVFNNGIGRPQGTFSSVDLIQPPIDVFGEYIMLPNNTYGPEMADWTYDGNGEPFFTLIMGGANQLPNGNMLICDPSNGNLKEISPNGSLEWHYIIPVQGDGPIIQGTLPGNNSSFRAYRYASNHPSLIDVDLISGDPIEIDPLPSDCEIFTSTTETEINETKIVYTFTSNNLSVHLLNTDQSFLKHITIYDVSGSVIYQDKFEDYEISINSSTWSLGLYLIEISDSNGQRLSIKKAIR